MFTERKEISVCLGKQRAVFLFFDDYDHYFEYGCHFIQNLLKSIS